MPRIELKKFTCLGSFVFLFILCFSLVLAAPVSLFAAQEPELTLNVPATVIPGSSFTVSGTLKTGEIPLANKPVGITIKDARKTIFTAAETKTSTDGAFAEEFTLPADAPAGAWEIHVAGEGTYRMKTFSVGVPTTGVATASPASLRRGETVTISGTLPQGNVEVGLTIYDPNGRVVFVDQKKAAADGKYQFNYTLPAEAVLGAYKALVAGAGTAGQATFTVTAPSSPGSGGGGNGVTIPPSTKKDIGPAGGELSAFEGKAKITIPAGALDKTISISLQKIDPAQVTPFPLTFKLMGEIYEISPSGTRFAKPVTITLKYDSTKLEGIQEDTLAIYYLDEQKNWVKLPSSVDKANRTVSAQVDHFSKFAPLAAKKEIKEEVAPSFGFKDLAENHWAWGEIKKLFALKIIGGYPDGTFKPENKVTRAEFAKILVKALGIPEETTGNPTFKDVSSAVWYFSCVQAAAKAGLVKGYPGNEFHPESLITREEMSVMLVRALGREKEGEEKAAESLLFADAPQVAAWAKGAVVIAVKEGLLRGYPDNTLGPQRNTTRAETCALICRFLERK